MSSTDELDDEPEDMVPWEDLSENQRREFAHMLQDHGLDVEVDEAEVYYGNRHRAEADIMRKSAMPEHEPAHDEHYGTVKGTDDPDAEFIELYGVGEFHPDVAGAGTPVFEAKVEASGSYLTFCFPEDDVAEEYMRVFHANAYVEGEFSTLMDRVLRHFQGDDPEPREVVFTTVVTEWLAGGDLFDAVQGFSKRTTEVPDTGEEITELVGEWDPRREG